MDDETTRTTRNESNQKRSKILSELMEKSAKINESLEANNLALNKINDKIIQQSQNNHEIHKSNVEESNEFLDSTALLNEITPETENNVWDNEDSYNFYDENFNYDSLINKEESVDETVLHNKNEEENQTEKLMLDDNEFLNNRDKDLAENIDKNEDEEDDTTGDDTEDTTTDDTSDDTNNDTDDTTSDDDDDDPEFRNKYKEVFEANKQKLSKKAKQAVEEDEKEMVSIIKSFKSKKIKSSKKSLDLKKFRNTVKEETLELKK